MNEQQLYYKYSHVGCPAAHMEDNCAHPADCAQNGRCLDLERGTFADIINKNNETEA